ncbi:MAG: phosphate ABC transporter substrate-binding protein PstS [Gemmatimonas sp.]
MTQTLRCWRLAVSLLLGAVGLACSSGERRTDRDSATTLAASGVRVDLTGAGATFPYPLYSRWFNDYAQRANVRINYHSVGSGNGIRQLLDGAVDFGATDAPMSDDEIAQSPTPIFHIPMVLGAVAITYNVPELTRPLKLSGEVLADLFLGRITRWNDSRLVVLNPGALLPARDVLVVHRADASGTSFIFSDYLAAASPRWQAGPGRGKMLAWPVGVGGSGNEGVAGQVKQVVGSIGYVEVVYARQNRLPVAHVRNRSGRFITPMPYEIASAAASMPHDSAGTPDLRRSLVNAPGDQAYPIVSFTWILLSPQRIGRDKSRALVDLLQWCLEEGGATASSLGYVPLPTVTAARVLELLDTIRTAAARRP